MSETGILTGSHFMNGDHACAEGAIAAGCRLFGGYPITPSTEVAERLARRLPQVGGVFIQMEDEMASIAAVLGASAAGSRAMTATSGPGFSLMMENLGLAIMMELPCLIVNIQRGSPSTGLPTLPGQSDIMQARWGSHGDYRLAAYSPWSPQEIFDLTIHGFNVADRYRIPVLLMADEVVGHMVERVVIPEAAEIPFWDRKRANGKAGETFHPFEPGEDLVPPFAHAGEGYRVHFTGLTHDTRGYPDMSAEMHQQLVRRLVDKVERNSAKLEMSDDYEVEDANILVLSYGSTARSARRAVREARELGIKAGALRLISIWPFPEQAFNALADQMDAFIVAEVNLGQMITEVERRVRTSKPVSGVHHAGGAMLPPGPILEEIKRVAGHA
ncbi:MAG: 2-oxoacid:acceptor oxidoreductase subunit alpha [Anaerolineales bacterium]|nr:2-oxoacid:acceptor oxidoreductase subunit alpha [Anaerolineales bacterium]